MNENKLTIDIAVASMKMHIETEDFESFNVTTQDHEKNETKKETCSKQQIKTMINILLI